MLARPQPRTERVTSRYRPDEVRRIAAAAQVAGVTVSDVIRQGALSLAGQVLRGTAEEQVQDS